MKDLHRWPRDQGRSRYWLAGLVTLAILGCQKPAAPTGGVKLETPNQPLTVFAAASTRAALVEVAQAFEADQHIGVTIVAGPSSALAKQIIAGADADLFLSADRASAEYLTQKQLAQRSVDLLTNRLVIVVPAESPHRIANLTDLAHDSIRRIALAEAKVPAGEYARQALGRVGLLDAVRDKMVSGVDVKATTQLVIRGEVEAGIVYRSDALGTRQLRIASEIPAELHAPIVYVLTQVKRDGAHPSTAAFYDFLQQQPARDIFERHEFGLVSP